MTTIAYNHKDKQIAYDSRESGEYILSDNVDKKYKKGDLLFFLSGSCNDIDVFMEQYPDIDSDIAVAGFLYDCGKVFFVEVHQAKLYKNKPSYNNASGSGGKFAIAAMDHGSSAADAVKYAMTRDLYTGGKVRVFNCE